MRQLQDGVAPQARRLLRLLFLRFGAVSTNAGRELQTIAQLKLDDIFGPNELARQLAPAQSRKRVRA
jgi:hypothetical protein